jgi:hypothetical protein
LITAMDLFKVMTSIGFFRLINAMNYFKVMALIRLD